MKNHVMLSVASLLSILLLTLHGADDIVRGVAPGGLANMIGLLILAVWLYGALVLAEQRSGHIIILVASLLASGVPVLHMTGSGLGGGIAKSSGVFFVWILLALGVTTIFSVILSARGLWSLKSGQPPPR